MCSSYSYFASFILFHHEASLFTVKLFILCPTICKLIIVRCVHTHTQTSSWECGMQLHYENEMVEFFVASLFKEYNFLNLLRNLCYTRFDMDSENMSSREGRTLCKKINKHKRQEGIVRIFLGMDKQDHQVLACQAMFFTHSKHDYSQTVILFTIFSYSSCYAFFFMHLFPIPTHSLTDDGLPHHFGHLCLNLIHFYLQLPHYFTFSPITMHPP